eukprot:gb/GECG01011691.1/.p1 GENE.gb/GECG01011691.1/~~gb/GECG01011691.1/.p1  ORF type:complete len:254 (+),score=19.09 gb/GECG01011691.1/:1-762(+)
MQGDHSGGIAAHRCGYQVSYDDENVVQIAECFSTGKIAGHYSGGICGSFAAEDGHVKIRHSYSRGAVTGSRSGGICGGTVGGSSDSYLFISYSYASGAVSGSDAGGVSSMAEDDSPGGATVDVRYCVIRGPLRRDLSVEVQNCRAISNVIGKVYTPFWSERIWAVPSEDELLILRYQMEPSPSTSPSPLASPSVTPSLTRTPSRTASSSLTPTKPIRERLQVLLRSQILLPGLQHRRPRKHRLPVLLRRELRR